MTIADEISKNLVDPENHGPILRTLLYLLDQDGEKGIKDWIANRIKEIEDESSSIDFDNEEEFSEESEG